MAEMTIRLRVDPETGKKDIIVSMRPDADALPHEHEQMHRQLVDRLIEGGTLQAGEVGKVVIEREEEAAQPESSARKQTQQERTSQAEGA